jgi:hypothetical protein
MGWKSKPHPQPVTIAFLTDGIKKLRAVGAEASDKLEGKDFYRSMRGARLTKEFLDNGGTELAPMSTSSDLSVALHYSGDAETRLIFKLVTSSFIDRGADLQYLSAFRRVSPKRDVVLGKNTPFSTRTPWLGFSAVYIWRLRVLRPGRRHF